MQLVFGDYVLDRERRELRRGSEQIALEPQVLDVLIHLVQNRDRVVTKDDLIACVWDGRIVSDSTLTSRVNAARRAVGDSGDRQEVIKTYARKGFRFLGEVRIAGAGDGSSGPTEKAKSRPRRRSVRLTPPSQTKVAVQALRLSGAVGPRSQCCRSAI